MPYDKIDALDLRRTVEAAKERKERQDLNLQRAKLAIEQQKMAAYQNMMNTQAQNNMLQNAYSQQGLQGAYQAEGNYGTFIGARYDGIVITPYVWSMRLDRSAFWYYGWDCASGCIWNASAVAELVPLPVVPTSATALVRQLDID